MENKAENKMYKAISDTLEDIKERNPLYSDIVTGFTYNINARCSLYIEANTPLRLLPFIAITGKKLGNINIITTVNSVQAKTNFYTFASLYTGKGYLNNSKLIQLTKKKGLSFVTIYKPQKRSNIVSMSKRVIKLYNKSFLKTLKIYAVFFKNKDIILQILEEINNITNKYPEIKKYGFHAYKGISFDEDSKGEIYIKFHFGFYEDIFPIGNRNKTKLYKDLEIFKKIKESKELYKDIYIGERDYNDGIPEMIIDKTVIINIEREQLKKALKKIPIVFYNTYFAFNSYYNDIAHNTYLSSLYLFNIEGVPNKIDKEL